MAAEYIDIKLYWNTLLAKKWKIVIITVTFSIIGTIYAVLSPEEFECKTVLLPERPSGKMGGASNLLKSFGIGAALGGTASDVPYFDPYYFENVVKSTNYYDFILNVKIESDLTDSLVSYSEYFTEHYDPGGLSLIKSYTIGLPVKILSLFKSESKGETKTVTPTDYYRFTEEEQILIERIGDRIKVEIDDNNGLIAITAKMPDRMSALSICNSVRGYLMDFSNEYTTAKLTSELDYLETQLNESKNKYDVATMKLAGFTDDNKFISKSTVSIQSEQLRNDQNLKFNIYNTLAQQYEETKLNLEKERVAFTIVSLPMYPLYKSEPKKKIIVAFSLALGLMLSITFYLSKEIVTQFIKENFKD